MRVTAIDIQLDRESGVFYAGEVVRGTVSFTVSGDVTCRGFQMHLTGKSHCHWHTGSGDSRKDFDGTTIFQDQRCTLHGNYYKSGCISDAGIDAYFGRANGDGTVVIPCEVEDSGRMELCVRVMDYDWGKRDDLLGELLIDAADLARSGEMKSFPLSRNGRPEKGQVTLSAKMMPFEAMFPTKTSPNGVAVSTTAVKAQCLVLMVHSATGLRKADWGGRNDVYVQFYRTTKEILPGKKLPGPDKSTVLPQGTTTYPFAFQLRSDAPGSAEIPTGDRAYVRYDLYAHAVFAKWRDPCSRRTIAVIPNRPVPRLELLAPAEQVTPPSPIYNVACCGMKCFRAQGLVSTSLSTGRSSYAPGEEIDLDGKVVNDTKKDLPVSVILRQYALLSTSLGASHKSRIDFKLLEGTCPALGTLNISSLPQKAVVPRVYPSFFGGVSGAKSRSFYPCLKWTYSIEIRAGAEKGSCSTAVHSRLPILIASAPPFPEAVERARTMRSVATTTHDPWQIFKYAVHGPEPCDTTPKITGSEDRGNIVPATNTGPIQTSNLHEDKGLLAPLPMYQPVVNAFDAAPSQQGPPETVAPAPTPALDMISPASGGPNSDTSQPTGVSALLSSLESAYDKRKAVGEFIRDHPEQAAKFTPKEVSQVLSMVTFSLEQASVASEIAAGFERSGNLTCQHIVAAMQACKYSMADVAKAMAPYANDPQNKGIVLSQLDYSFEREDVAKYFCQ